MIKRTLLTIALTLGMCGGNPNIEDIREKDNSDPYHQVDARHDDLAVILVDMQTGFVGKIDKRELEEEVQNQIDVIDYAGHHSIPIYVLEFAGDGQTIPELKEKLNQYESVHYILKDRNNDFRRTRLGEMLSDEGIKIVLLMGINASACVWGTAYGALDENLQIMTSRDLIAEPVSWGDNESACWYSRHGVLRRNYFDLLDMIERGETGIQLPKKELGISERDYCP